MRMDRRTFIKTLGLALGVGAVGATANEILGPFLQEKAPLTNPNRSRDAEPLENRHIDMSEFILKNAEADGTKEHPFSLDYERLAEAGVFDSEHQEFVAHTGEVLTLDFSNEQLFGKFIRLLSVSTQVAWSNQPPENYQKTGEDAPFGDVLVGMRLHGGKFILKGNTTLLGTGVDRIVHYIGSGGLDDGIQIVGMSFEDLNLRKQSIRGDYYCPAPSMISSDNGHIEVSGTVLRFPDYYSLGITVDSGSESQLARGISLNVTDDSKRSLWVSGTWVIDCLWDAITGTNVKVLSVDDCRLYQHPFFRSLYRRGVGVSATHSAVDVDIKASQIIYGKGVFLGNDAIGELSIESTRIDTEQWAIDILTFGPPNEIPLKNLEIICGRSMENGGEVALDLKADSKLIIDNLNFIFEYADPSSVPLCNILSLSNVFDLFDVLSENKDEQLTNIEAKYLERLPTEPIFITRENGDKVSFNLSIVAEILRSNREAIIQWSHSDELIQFNNVFLQYDLVHERIGIKIMSNLSERIFYLQ